MSAEKEPHTLAKKPHMSAKKKPHMSAEKEPHMSAEKKPHTSTEEHHTSAEQKTEKEALCGEANATAITVTNSPVKEEDFKMWIPALELYFNNKQVLMSTSWVNDKIVSVAQRLLKQQCQGKVFGWASPQCSKRNVAES